MNALASGGFWAFVGVVAGIYTIFALGLQLQFGLAGLLNFGQVAFMAIGAYTMAILVVKEGWSTWLAAPLGVVAAGAAGLLLGHPGAAAPSRLLRDRHDRLQRDRPLRGDERGLAHGRLAGDDRARQDRHGRAVQRAVGALPGARPGLARHLLEGRRDARDRLGSSRSCCSRSSGSPCGRRGAGCCARSARTRTRPHRSARTCSPTSSRRSRSARRSRASPGASTPGSSRSSARTTSQPLLTFFAWMIVIIGGLGRVWAVPVGALVFGFLFAGTRFLDFPPLSYLERRRPRLRAADRDRARDHRARARAAAGAPRQARRDGARVSALLEVRDVVRAFGGVRAVDGATLDVEAGSITGLIGPNGAGKSTLFNCVSGFLRPQSGRVRLDGKRIDRRAPHRIARAGLVRTFQTPRALTRMTVLENVMLAAPRNRGERLGRALAPSARRREREVPRPRARAARARAARRARGRARRHALRRPAQAARPRARADGRAADPAPRRADGRRQPDAARRAARAHPRRCATATA